MELYHSDSLLMNSLLTENLMDPSSKKKKKNDAVQQRHNWAINWLSIWAIISSSYRQRWRRHFLTSGNQGKQCTSAISLFSKDLETTPRLLATCVVVWIRVSFSEKPSARYYLTRWKCRRFWKRNCHCRKESHKNLKEFFSKRCSERNAHKMSGHKDLYLSRTEESLSTDDATPLVPLL